MQMDMMAEPQNYSSAHEMAIFRAVTTSKNIREAVRKVNLLKDGRIENKKGYEIIDNLLINFSVSGR